MDATASSSETSARFTESDSAFALSYKSPYRFNDLLEFFRVRALFDVELVDDEIYSRTVRIAHDDGTLSTGWIRVQNDEQRSQLVVSMSDGLERCRSAITERVRQVFDLDCDPAVIAKGLSALLDEKPTAVIDGVRLPGCFDPFETACRAVLGQQISVKAAGGLARRIVETYGDKIDTGIEGLARAWPTPQAILALDPIENALGELGVIQTRARAIFEIARMVESGELDLSLGANGEQAFERLLSIRGIGPWTAGYIAMRALAHTDVFLETDAGIVHALPEFSPKERLNFVEACRPWRSYAVIALWNSLG